MTDEAAAVFDDVGGLDVSAGEISDSFRRDVVDVEFGVRLCDMTRNQPVDELMMIYWSIERTGLVWVRL